jgi:hypothetical protein
VESKPQIESNAGLVSIARSLMMKGATLPSLAVDKSHMFDLLTLRL